MVKRIEQVKKELDRPAVMTVHSTEFGRCGNQFFDGPSSHVRDIEWWGTEVADRVMEEIAQRESVSVSDQDLALPSVGVDSEALDAPVRRPVTGAARATAIDAASRPAEKRRSLLATLDTPVGVVVTLLLAIGMMMAFELSARLGLCPGEEVARVARHFAVVGLPTSPAAVRGRAWNSDRLIAHMGKDKKVSGGRLTFVLVRGIGKAFVTQEVALAEVAAVLERALAA